MSSVIKKRIIDTNDFIRVKVEQAEHEFNALNLGNIEHIGGEPDNVGTDPSSGDESDEGENGAAGQEPQEEVPPEPDLIELAEIEAENILSAARSEATAIIEDANAKADMIRAEAYTSGEAEGRSAAEAEYAEKLSALEAREQELVADYTAKSESMEQDMMELLLDIFEQVFKIKYSDDRELLLYIIKNSLKGIGETKSYKIKVSEADIALVRERKEEFVQIVGTDVNLDIVMDADMSPGDCVIDADSGVYDVCLKVQLENLDKELKALSVLKGE